MSNRIITKPYFWIALGVPSLFSIVSAIIIYIDKKPEFFFTKSGLDNFTEFYSIPLQLFGLILILVGASFTYYRIDLSYRQNERQIYSSFKDEFLSVLEAKKYEYKILDVPDIWLFNNLYPNAKNGDQELTTEFEDFIIYEDELSHQGFVEAMKNLGKVIRIKDQYFAGAHSPLGNMFLWLREIIPIDADLNIGYMGGAKFEGKYSEYIIDLSKDIFFIVTSVNAFEGWRFFDNKSKRTWRKNIDRLENITKECEQINVFFEKARKAQWINTLIRNDYSTFKKFNLQDVMPAEIINNKNAKEYILEAWTGKSGTKIISEEEAVSAFKEKLNV